VPRRFTPFVHEVANGACAPAPQKEAIMPRIADGRSVPAIVVTLVAAVLVVLTLDAITVRDHGPGAQLVKSGAWATDAEAGVLSAPSVAVRSQRVVSWVAGLANGLILPSDVALRLGQQDPALAERVNETWTALAVLRHDAERLRRASRWVNGLSSGLLLGSDLSGRLRSQDAEMADAVTAAWTVLRRPEE
jgi:hypothetical protein